MFFQVRGHEQSSGGIQFGNRGAIQEISLELTNFGVKIIQLAYSGENGLPAFHRVEAQAFFKTAIDDKLGSAVFRKLFFKAYREQEATFGVQSSFVFAQKTNHL